MSLKHIKCYMSVSYVININMIKTKFLAPIGLTPAPPLVIQS